MRPIDADALPRLTQIYEFNGKRMEREIVDAKFIDNAPTMEAEPTVHAEWVTVYGDHLSMGNRVWGLACSNCGRIGEVSRYCPYCGAKMDGGK